MKADKIIKNAKIFTSDKDKPMASALAVKDGKFVYVGDEAGLSAYEGEVTDLGGKFVMPGIIDSHVHVTIGVGFDYIDPGVLVPCAGKQAILDFMADSVRKNPDLKCHHFSLEQKLLEGARIVKEDLDAICPDAELLIVEAECHSVWTNSRLLARHGITDETPDPVPGLSYYVRKDGHVTGNIFEGTAELPIMLDGSMELSDAQVDAALQRWIDFSVEHGVNAVFDAGIPGFGKFHERVYQRLRALDKQGKLPVYIDGCYVVSSPREIREGLEELRRMKREYNTEHLNVHTLKIFIDGTLKIHTAAMVEPYNDIPKMGVTSFSKEELADVIVKLNEDGMDLHTHTVGDAASRVVLDAVEIARKRLGESYRVRVTCAHLKFQHDADLDRFVKLGVFANFTPWWNSELPSEQIPLFGEERTRKMYRCKTLWNTGALVTWSCDNINFGDFSTWNPYLGMEVGMTRWINEKTNLPEFFRTPAAFPSASERMSVEEMILGYTINGAKQLGIEAEKGSITAGKDADFLVFDNDLLTAEHEGFSYNKPRDVFFCGKKVN